MITGLCFRFDVDDSGLWKASLVALAVSFRFLQCQYVLKRAYTDCNKSGQKVV